MKTIIALWNTANCGKTETLRHLARILVETFPNNFELDPPGPTIPGQGDFRLIVRTGERIVALETQGDPGYGLAEKLDELSGRFEADLIFCSTRTRGETVHAVENLARTRDFEVIWTSTYTNDDSDRHDFLNNLKADHIFDLARRANLI